MARKGSYGDGDEVSKMKNKRQLESILLVFIFVSSSIVIVVPLTAPKARGQIVHDSGSAQAEDGIWPFDIDGDADGIVHWNPNEDHWIEENYTVESGYTLDIPAMNFMGNPSTANEITFRGRGHKIEVWGTLLTHTNSLMPRLWTAFLDGDGTGWEGIIFRPGGAGNIQDCLFSGAKRAVRYFPAPLPGPGGSIMLEPGIYRSHFMDIEEYGVEVSGAEGYTNVELCYFDQSTNPRGRGLQVIRGNLDIKNSMFISHGDDEPQLYIWDSIVHAEEVTFTGAGRSGSLVRIREKSNGTVLTQCKFQTGAPGDHYIWTQGCTPLIDNCTFETKDGQLSVIAEEKYIGPSHPILRNASSMLPGNDDAPFDNSTINATGASSVTLQWYMHVNVKNPLGHPIENAPVWVKNRTGDPAEPPSKITDSKGWALWFLITELIQYNDSRAIFNPFNVSALNHSVKGYADPEPTMNLSKAVYVMVPFNVIPNSPPSVWVYTPSGIQSGNITLDFVLEDFDKGDDGNMSISVEYSTDGTSWDEAIAGPGSDLEHLFNDTLYHFVWDSKADLGSILNTTVYIRITPADRAGNGTKNQTGNFTVDNKPPELISGPTVDVTNVTATIQWTVNESADASVWYGLDGSLTNYATGNSGSTLQSVALTDLQPGRRYTYTVNSMDQYGNEYTSSIYIFETKVHIQLYKGWNMISVPPFITDPSLESVLISISGQYDAVQWYDPADGKDPWKHNRPGKPFGNDLDIIETRMGLWIHMTEDATLIPDQIVPDPDYSEFISLVNGWNLVGYPSVTSLDVADALDTVPYDMVLTYDAPTGQWLRYDPGTGSGDLSQMELGHGYYIHATFDFPWEVTYV